MPESAPQRRRSAGGAGTLILVALIVLILAVAGGLFTAWIVANMRAAPGSVAGASPTPAVQQSAVPASAVASPTDEASEAPRRTPTPAPTAEITPEPFVHVVQPGESLTYIAGLYGVGVQDVIDLNGIRNPDRIQVGQEILIPGYGVPPTPKPPRR
jgi:LysM repeat protein